MSSSLDQAVKQVKYLVKNRRKPYAVAIDMIAKEFNLGTKELSDAVRNKQPKKKIIWKKPNFRDELDEYFDNQETKNFLFQKGYQFQTNEDLLDFLKRGKMEEISRFTLMGMDNITTDPGDFEEELKDENYASSYKNMSKKLRQESKLTLPAPILLKIGDRYYGFAGNRRMNLAWRNNLPVKFWTIEAPDMGLKQKSLF